MDWFELSPINKRRLRAFKSNSRGYYSFILFMTLFLLTLFGEFIANDKPFLVKYDGAYYTPIFKMYTEKQFGGEFETEADYRDPEVKRLIEEKGGWMVWPLIPYSYRTIKLDLPVPAPAPPSWENWLGTDDQGRDVLARVIYGFRISVLFGLILTIFSALVGVTAGAIQGFFGGWTDLFFQRFIEILSSLPLLYLLLILSAILAPSFWTLLGIMLCLRVDGFCRAGARRISARQELRICAGGARAWADQCADHVQAHPPERRGRDGDIRAFYSRLVPSRR